MDDQNTQDPQEEIVDATIVDETEESTVKEPEVVGDAAILLNLEEMIKNYIQSLEKLREEKKKHQEMFEDSFVNNPVYRENCRESKRSA